MCVRGSYPWWDGTLTSVRGADLLGVEAVLDREQRRLGAVTDTDLRKVANLPNPTDLYLQVVEEMYEPEASEARRRPAKIDDGV